MSDSVSTVNTNKLWKDMVKQMPTIFLLQGPSKSGKSHMLKFLLYKLCDPVKPIFNFGIVLTGSEFNHEYDFIQESAVHPYSAELLESYVENLKKIKNESKGAKMPHSFIVLDDVLGKISKTAYWTNFISIYRHLGISLFITTQYLKASEASSTFIREQTGLAFMFSSPNLNTTKALFDYFGSSIFDNFDKFQIRYKECTEERYHCMLFISDTELKNKDKNLINITAQKELPKRKIEF